MGRLDQYAKEIFASETLAITHGAVAWQAPEELNLSELRLDGRLLVRDPAPLLDLAAPWSQIRKSDEVVIEVKMQGDHLDMLETERGLLRRQARQVQRMADPKLPWEGDLPFWMVASHVPAAVRRQRIVRKLAPGCYGVEPYPFQFLWIAANELPLCDELVPFLIARTGRALDTFGRWIQTRRSPDWLLRMVEFLPMSTAVHEEMLRFVLTKTEDPEVKARQKLIAKVYVDMTPEVKDELRAEALKEGLKEGLDKGLKEGLDKGRLAEARSALRRVLSRRKLTLEADEQARIDACTDLAMLERWHDQAVDASSVEDVLR